MWHLHWPYIQACREKKVAYRLIDLTSADWIGQVQKSGCDAFLVWPSVQLGIWKQMFDDRLHILARDLGKMVCPTPEEIWLYESK